MIKFRYTNHKGETEEREVEVLALDFDENPSYGYAPGWFLTCRDPSRDGATRSFRLDDRMVPANSARHQNSPTLFRYELVEASAVKAAVDNLADHARRFSGVSAAAMAELRKVIYK